MNDLLTAEPAQKRHLKFTVPLAAVLTLISYPILSRIQWHKIAFLITVAFTATLPWDAYLIHHHVWTYPADAIIGPRLLGVPAEELFFFVIQTYITSVVYIVMNKPLLHVQYLTRPVGRYLQTPGVTLLQSSLALATLVGLVLVVRRGPGTYLGLILVWACPVALLTWTLAGRFMIQLPWTSTVFPVLAPTAYLWLVDEMALGRGTWAIESGTKLGICVWGSLEIEEAVFFLATNVLIVFGLAAFDHSLAIMDAFPDLFPRYSAENPSPVSLMTALLTDPAQYDMERIRGIQEAVVRLRRKSRSFYLASSAFAGRLGVDLILL